MRSTRACPIAATCPAFLRGLGTGTFSSCLTGSAQIAIVNFRPHDATGVTAYRDAGDRLTNFLKALQALDSPSPAINGAPAGSFPLFGEYMRAGYRTGRPSTCSMRISRRRVRRKRRACRRARASGTRSRCRATGD
jgi:hypothetical protein